MKEKLAALTKQIADQRKEFIQASKTLLAEGFKEIFNKYQYLNSIGWNQYTPYFNDGDTCEFEVHADKDALIINGEVMYRIHNHKTGMPLWYAAVAEEVSDLLFSIDSGLLQDIYGDHVKVTIYRDRLQVDECDHD